MSTATIPPTSYFARCQQWLDSDSTITVEGLEQTIEKFSRQLGSEQAADSMLKEDLQNTLDLLNNHLVELLGPDGESSLAVSVSAAESAPGSPEGDEPSVDTLLDFSPLQPIDTQPLHLSDSEKRERIAEMLARGVVTRGVAK